MSQNSLIEWTDSTWNPVRGCSRVSPGCLNCYAEKVATRFSDPGQPFHLFADRFPKPHWTGKVELVESHLLDPLKWRNPKRIFVNSMSDLFHEGLSDEAIDRVFAVMALCPQHTFQILTKRPERIAKYFSLVRPSQVDASIEELMVTAKTESHMCFVQDDGVYGWPLPNVWLGVSVENQDAADERIPLLLQTPAAVRFVSYEPALGQVDFMPWLRSGCSQCGQRFSDSACGPTHAAIWSLRGKTGNSIDWVIVGGESGPGARPFDVAWARSTVAQCAFTGVACFVKQLGASPMAAMSGESGWIEPELASWPHDTRFSQKLPGDQSHRVHLKSRKGGDMSEWPEDLRVRQFPDK